MIEREFVKLNSEEIADRKKMYEEADSLGIDLMSYDDDSSEARTKRKNRRKAILLIGTGKPVPKYLKNALTQKV